MAENIFVQQDEWKRKSNIYTQVARFRDGGKERERLRESEKFSVCSSCLLP